LSLILASASRIRRQMLDAAGVDYETAEAQIDEAAIKSRSIDAYDIASKLCAAKALSVTAASADWVIGSDSVVSVDGRVFDKPRDRREAADHLKFFSGKLMYLTSAVALVREAELAWRHVDTAELHVRRLSDTFIDHYLDADWPEVSHSVGVFRLEARGVQLFSSIKGDYFTILGMPLIPLLAALRERGLLPA